MKFIKRKPQRDDIPQYIEQPQTAAKRQPSPSGATGNGGPAPPPKELPPTPLYARYARMASTTSFESLNTGNNLSIHDATSAARFSAINGSTVSGFNASASLHSATPSAEGHATGVGSHGRAAGSALYGSGNISSARPGLANGFTKAEAKPEPIKLKPRRVRTTNDDAPRVVSTLDKSNGVGASSSRPGTGLANGSSELPTTNGTAKLSVDNAANGLSGRTNGPYHGADNTSTTLGSSHPANTTNLAINGTNTSRSISAQRNSTAPTPKPSVQDDVPSDLFAMYNAALRVAESPMSNSRTPSPTPTPSPSRPKEGPPIALLNRVQKNVKSESTSRPSQEENEILVKPPSRRESLQHAAKAASDAFKPPTAQDLPIHRAPSPSKSRSVVSPDSGVVDLSNDPVVPTPKRVPTEETPPAEFSMAGVGAGKRFSALPKARPPSIQDKPAPAVAFPTAMQPTPITTGRYTASPNSLTPAAFPSVSSPPQQIPPPRSTATPEPKYPNSIPEKTPLTKGIPTPAATPKREGAISPTGIPKASSLPVPASNASSVTTIRQSRINASTPTPESSASTKEEVSSFSQPSARHARIPRSNIPMPESKPVSFPSSLPPPESPSRQNSSASVASSSVPSVTQSRSTTTSPSGLETPEDLLGSSPFVRSPTESLHEVKKITLKKGSNRINSANRGRSRDLDFTPASEPKKDPVQESQPETITARRAREAARLKEIHDHRDPPRYSESEPEPEPLVPSRRHNVQPTQAERTERHINREEMQEVPRSPVEYDATERSGGRDSQMHQPRASRYVPEPEYDPDIIYPIEEHLAVPELLAALLYHLQFSDILALSSVSKSVRNMLEDTRDLKEEILERFLGTVGYMRWDFGKKREPLVLTLRDLNSYLRGVSIPIHRYAEIAEGQTLAGKEGSKSRIVRLLASSTRAYSKVVLRLRLQAEMEATVAQQEDRSRSTSPLVRAQSPSMDANTWKKTFHSPLYRIGHAPLLRVFVPSPEGPWLSDTSVLACEKELKRAGIVQLLKVGDVIWDTAVTDEAGFGNVGRLIWDGNYLIDLDYTFSTTGDIPPYLHSLSFPPAYFHKVLRSSGNPIMQLDLRPWGREIASNLQLVQDRAQAETPQGGRHTVMRWTHRSRFQVIHGTPIPDTNLVVDGGWEGTIVLEAEGTNEGLADLQLRCGMEWFKPQPGVQPKQGDGGRVYRLIRERSRPGEIWLRTVRMKERIS